MIILGRHRFSVEEKGGRRKDESHEGLAYQEKMISIFRLFCFLDFFLLVFSGKS